MASCNIINSLRNNGGIVFVGGDFNKEHELLAEPLGTAIALNGLSLMTGGGTGVDLAVSRGFVSVDGRKGKCCASIWRGMKGYKLPGIYPNRFIELELHLKPPNLKIGEHQVTSRNHMNDVDICIFLPGGAETKTQIEIARGYEHPIAVSSFWIDIFPDCWNFESIEDCIALCNSVLRDKKKRPDIHKKKVANVLDGKSGHYLRSEEVRRCHDAKENNEAYVALLEKLEKSRFTNDS